MRQFDSDALERFRKYLRLLAGSQLDSRWAGQIDASDVVQQTMLNALANAEQFRGKTECDLLGWLRQILANHLTDLIRRHRRAKRDVARCQSLDESIFEAFRRVEALALSCSTPSQNAVRNEQLLRLPEALETLTETQREAIVLHHLHGLKLVETARLMGKSETAVCGLLHRGMKRLHEILGD
ncbi:MAG: sigma-70 family RNA polymerase sigma factor [Planctomycetales bacterium]|nr:sigma-70 family RNA polymerase sigma factor [Planctomycetales bacterium]